jgi:hypothetical protein
MERSLRRQQRRLLRAEMLEDRRMLTTTLWNLGTQGNFSQPWSDTTLISANNNWNNVPSIMGYQGEGLTKLCEPGGVR